MTDLEQELQKQIDLYKDMQVRQERNYLLAIEQYQIATKRANRLSAISRWVTAFQLMCIAVQVYQILASVAP